MHEVVHQVFELVNCSYFLEGELLEFHFVKTEELANEVGSEELDILNAYLVSV